MLQLNTLFYIYVTGFIIAFISWRSVYVKCIQWQGGYSEDSKSHISSDVIERKYISNHTKIYNHHLIPYVIDYIPDQSCGMLYKTYFYENFTKHPLKNYDAHLGVVIKPSCTENPPIFEWYDAEGKDYYTVMMFDIDFPNATHPVERNWLNYLVVNSKGYKRLRKARELAEYIGAWPLKGTGLHRYVCLVYQQPKRINFTTVETIMEYDFLTRRNFDHRAFAKKHHLGDPVCVNFFMSEWEEWVDETYKRFYSRHPSFFTTKEILKEAYLSDLFMSIEFNGSQPEF